MGTSTGGDATLTSGNGHNRGFSRRGFLRVTGGLMALGVVGVLGACSQSSPTAPSAPATGAVSGAAPTAASVTKLANLLPTYIPTPGAPKADLPSTGPGIDDA